MKSDQGISVLLVDDEPAVADLVASHLERIHDEMTVAVVTTVTAALYRVRDESFDCIVSDYDMPEMDGLAFFDAVRDIDATLPIILFTGKGSEEIANEAISAGVTDYLQKRVGTEQYELLANRIENAVEATRAECRVAELSRINSVISDVQRELVRQSTRADIEDAVCACLANSEPYTLAWVGEPNNDHEFVFRSRAGIGTEYLDEIAIRTDDTPRGRGPAGTAFHTGEVQATRDIAEDAAFEPWREAARRYGHKSAIVLPLSYNGARYGVLVIYSARRHAFDDDERSALVEVAGTIGQAIHATEIRAQLEHRERELRAERAVTESLIETLPDPVYVFDPEGTMLRWNDAFAQAVGYTDEEIASANVYEFVPAEDREWIRAIARKIIERDTPGTGESRFVTKDGEVVPYEFTGACLADGTDIIGIIGSARDIAARVQREETGVALHEATRDLVRAENRKEVATVTAEAAAEILGFPITTVRLYDPETDALEPAASTDATNQVLGERPAFAREEALPWRAFSSAEPVLTAGSVAAYGANDLPLRSAMYVPIENHGTISIGSVDSDLKDTDVRLTQVLAANAAAALDRVEREAQLRRDEQMLDAAGDAIYLLDIDGTIRYGNAAAEALTGYTVDELIGEHISTVQNAEDTATGRAIVEELVAAAPSNNSDEALLEKTDTSFENTVQTADGEKISCESRLALLEENGDIEGVVGVARDITERKRRERMVETLHDTTRLMIRATTPDAVAAIAVETMERVLGMAINAAWLYDANDELLQPAAMSERAQELFGTLPTYAAGNNSLSWTAFEHGETRKYDRLDSEANVSNPNTLVKSEIIAPFGEYGVLNIGSTEPDVFDDGDVSLANLLATNTAAALNRVERERLLREHERELERQNARLEEFASVVSHDLRNPLGVARGRLELAHADSPTEHHDDIRWALSRMDSLIEGLLALARQGRVVDDTERVSLSTVTETAWRTTGIETASLVVENPGELDADADRLSRLFENLFRNAIEHAGDDVTVTVGAFDAGFYVADDGPGIPTEKRESVFEHGYSTGEKNTGLGLTIVRSIAEAHGWEITVTESDAGGARFEVRV